MEMLHDVSAAATLLLLLALALNHGCAASSVDVSPARGLVEVPHDRVELRGGFWGRRQETHHETTVPYALDRLEEAGHVANFDLAAGVGEGPISGHHAFDSDLHKALEGAMYSLAHPLGILTSSAETTNINVR